MNLSNTSVQAHLKKVTGNMALFKAVQWRSLVKDNVIYMRDVFFKQYQNTKSFLPFKLTKTTGSFRTILTFTRGIKDTRKSHMSGTITSKLLVCHCI